MNVLDLLKTANVAHRLAGEDHHVGRGWVHVECPFCRERGKFHCGIHLGGNVANCWICGPHPAKTVLQALHVDTSQLRFSRPPADRRHVRGQLQFPYGTCDLGRPHRDYLSLRGFNSDLIERLWGVRAISVAPRYGWSLLIPIRSITETISWTTRAIGRTGKRYDNAPSECELFPAKSTLYGIELARHAIVIVEGPTDAWRIGPGAVATMGLQYTVEQVNLMRRFPVRAVCFDNSLGANQQARKLYRQLQAFPGKTLLCELDASDPGEASRDEIDSLRSHVGI